MSTHTHDRPGPGRPRDAARDAAIMEAVVRLIGERGFDATSIDGVAAASGVSKATIYRRWPGKTELVVDTVRRNRRDPVDPADTGSLRSDLIALVAEDAALLAADGGLVAGVVVAMRSRPELRAAVTDAAVAEFQRRFTAVVARGTARREIATDVDLDLLVEVTRSTLLGRVVYDPTPTGPEFAERLVDRVLLPLLRHPHTDEGVHP